SGQQHGDGERASAGEKSTTIDPEGHGFPLGLRRALDRAQDAHVSATAALEIRQRIADLRVARVRVLVEQRDRSQYPAVEAIAALRHLLFDERGLYLVRLVRAADSGERDDLARADGIDRRDAGAHRLAVDQHGARTALREPAAEARFFHAQSVT